MKTLKNSRTILNFLFFNFSLKKIFLHSKSSDRENHTRTGDSRISQAADNVQSTFSVLLRHEFKLEIKILFYHPHTNGGT